MDWQGIERLEEGDVVLYPSPRRLALLCGLGFGLLALALLIIVDAFAWEVRGKFLFFSYFSAPFTAFLGVKSLLGILAPSPSLVANKAGIYHNAGLLGFGVIPWEDVREVVCHRFQGGREQVYIVPVDARVLLGRQPWLKRRLLRSIGYFAFHSDPKAPSTICIDWGDMSDTAEVTCRRILERRPGSGPPPPEPEHWAG